jgi:rhamnose transport system substrate-binding protein
VTAVVLGGTSIFGGRGSVVGTLLVLFAIAVLQNGTRLADLPAELAGALTGILLLTAIGLDRRGKPARPATRPNEGELSMRNSQLAVLCGVILLGAGAIAYTNYLLGKSVQDAIKGRPSPGVNGVSHSPTGKKLTLAMMPKSKGNAYFIACKKGADEAAAELGVDLIWDGPTETDPAKQNEVIETWITRGVDVIAVAVENREGLSTVLRKAREKGIKVVTWDADAEPDARDFFVNQATPEGIGRALMDHTARLLGNKGEYAIITASLTAGNQNEWRKHISARNGEKYPDVKLATVQPCDDQQKKAFEVTNTVLNAHPNVKLIMAICTPAVPGAAEAVKQSGRSDVKVVGLGLPNDNKRFVKDGITEAVVLWNTMDLGYLAVEVAAAAARGDLKPGATQFQGGRLGTLQIRGTDVLLGEPFTFDKTNIDKFDF